LANAEVCERAAQRRRTLIIVCFLLALITVASFWPVSEADFVHMDDKNYVYENPYVLAGLSRETLAWAFTTYHAAMWQPLVWISYQVDVHLCALIVGGLDARVFHITNLALHIANTLLLFLFLDFLTRRLWPSAFVAALFAIHPLHVESVAWIAERKDVLSTFFMLICLWTYAADVRQKKTILSLISIIAFALGLMSKAMLITTPFLLLAMDFWPLGRLTGPKREKLLSLIADKIHYFALSAISAVLTYQAAKIGGSMASLDYLPLNLRLPNAAVGFVVYLKLLFAPVNLACLYPHPRDTLPIWQVMGSTVLLAAITAAAVIFCRRLPYLAFGWFWYVVTLAPVSGLLQQGKQVVTDHFSYVPLIGLFVAISWGLADLSRVLFGSGIMRRAVAAVGALFALTLLGYLTSKQARVWQDSITLFTHALSVGAHDATSYKCLADAVMDKGETQRALALYRKAIEIQPKYVEAHYNLATHLAKMGRLAEAEKHFRIAIAIFPKASEFHNNFGITLMQLGKRDEAIRHFKEALRLNPESQSAADNLARAEGRLEEE